MHRVQYNYVELINFAGIRGEEWHRKRWPPNVVAIPSETPFRRADPGSRGQVIGSTAVASIPRYGVDTRADCHRPPRRRGQTHLVAGSRVDTRLRRHLTPSTFPRVLAPRRPIPTPSPKVPTKASACNSLLNSPPLYVPTADAVINCRPLRSSCSSPPNDRETKSNILENNDQVFRENQVFRLAMRGLILTWFRRDDINILDIFY